MNLKNKASLDIMADAIHDEVRDGYNTATRIGQMFKDLIDATDNTIELVTNKHDSDIGEERAARGQADNILASDLAELRDMAEETSRHTDDLLDWKPEVNDSLAELQVQKLDRNDLLVLTESAFEALTEKDNDKYYFTYED